MTLSKDKLDTLAESFDPQSGVSRGKFFGFDCLLVNGKTFAIQSEEDMVFKLDGDAHTQALSLQEAVLWNPYGREKKAWVQVPAAFESDWNTFAAHAREYVQRVNNS